MTRVINFGERTLNERLDIIKSYLRPKEILLFQYYEFEENANHENDNINYYFDNYCDNVIYYYNPQLCLDIDQAVSDILREDLSKIALYEQCKNKITAEELLLHMKERNYTGISEDKLESIKVMVYIKLMKYNIDNEIYNYVMERKYGNSKWILDQYGIRQESSGALWYKPLNQDECLRILQNN